MLAVLVLIAARRVSKDSRIHRGDELEFRGELGLARGARDADAARFERLAQHFEHSPVELGELVQEKRYYSYITLI